MFLDVKGRFVPVSGTGTQGIEVARCMCGLRLRGGAGVSLFRLECTVISNRSLETQVSVRMGHLGDGHQLAEVIQAVHAKPCWSCSRLTGDTTLILPHLEELQVRPTSFRGGEFLGFTARPITSPIDHNHLQLVVTVGEQASHHAPGAVTREAGLLSLLRHPQVLQQTAFPPVVSLRDRGRLVRDQAARPG